MYPVYTRGRHGVTNTYLTQRVPSISHHLEPLDKLVRTQLVTQLMALPPQSDLEMNLMSLPARPNGLGFAMPLLQSSDTFNASLKVTAPLQK